MTRWTLARVTALAPDAAALTAARRLARPGPWSDTGSTEVLVWGKCQGSGRVPYQVSVDLTGPAFRCTCPSRKFPCKHGLALLLLWVDGAGSVAEVDAAAGFAADWAAERSARAAATGARTPPKPPDPAAAAKRREERLALMTGGMEDFARWLADLVRSGTAAARQQGYGWWDGTAARLVDAQLPGLAEDVRSTGGEIGSRSDWTERLLIALGRWWTATRAWAGRERLSEAEFGDLRAYLGWATTADSVRQADALTDRWLVLGAHRSDDGTLQQQRTWLHGRGSGETVQVLDFAAGGQVLPVARAVGSTLDATVARYPGAAVRRALFVDDPVVVDGPAEPPSGGTVADALGTAAAVWAANPWAARVPVTVAGLRVGHRLGAYAADETGGLPLAADSGSLTLLALTGGRPVRIFGELEDGRLRPLAVEVDRAWVGL